MSTLSLNADELRVESFATGHAAFQPAEFTDAAPAGEPATSDEPTITGCTCFATCFGGVCQTTDTSAAA